jgi:uncharacterized protein with PQ loop repeat
MTIFALITTVLGVGRAVPQLLRLLRTRQTNGVSVDTAATSCIVSCSWAVYGLWTNQPAMSMASGATSAIFALITVLALRYGRRLRELRVTPLWLTVLVLAGAIGGATGLSLILPISVLAANLPQLRVARNEGNLADLSLGTWLLALTEGFVWGGYGLLVGDIAVLVNNVFQVTTSGLIVAAKVASLRKRPGDLSSARPARVEPRHRP